jgi:hypothetical protein
MQLENRKALEIVGVFAVVGSLIFVGLQLVLDRRVAISAQYAARAESIKEDRRALLESDSYMSLQTKNWADGIRPDWWTEELEKIYSGRGLTGAEIYSEIIRIRMYLTHADNMHFQYSQGLLDQFFYDEIVAHLKEELKNPLRKAIYLATPLRLDHLFETLLNEIENERLNTSSNS